MDRNWVWEVNPFSITLSPIWPKPFSEGVLFLGIPSVILTSATIVPKTAELLGIPTGNLNYREFPHSFPEANRPLIHIPTVGMNYRIGEMENRIWLARLDKIIEANLGTKGIVHTVSYARRDLVLDRSAHKQHMMTHQRVNTESVVRSFKSSPAPAILVSPSMVTGWDFPGDECRWQVIVKMPYPDTRGTIMKARSNGDKDFINYIVVQQLIQATGRGCRSEDDFCATFVIDNNITWFLDRNKHLLVEWFGGAYRVERTVPKPLIGGRDE
jgi:ATP-dependent DNA helicase DinG